MLRLAGILMLSTVVFGLATFGPFAFLLVVCALAAWALWSGRSRARSDG